MLESANSFLGRKEAHMRRCYLTVRLKFRSSLATVPGYLHRRRIFAWPEFQFPSLDS